MGQRAAGEELEQEECQVEYYVKHKEAVNDPQYEGARIQRVVVGHEDAPDLQD